MKYNEITEGGFYWIKDYYFFGDVIVDIYKSVSGWRVRGIVGCPDFEGATPLLEIFAKWGWEFFPVEPLSD